MPLTNSGEVAVLDEIFNAGSGTFPTGDPYVALHTADPGETGANEVTGGSYARQQAVFGAAASPAGTLSNSANIDFTGMPAGDVVAWSIWDAVSAGACYVTGWFSTISNLALVRDADLTSDDVQSHEHGFVANDRVVFEQVEGLTLPNILVAGTLYYVIATGLTTDAFRFSATQGGAAVNMTASGVAIVRKVNVTTLGAGNTFRVAAGDLDVFAE